MQFVIRQSDRHKVNKAELDVRSYFHSGASSEKLLIAPVITDFSISCINEQRKVSSNKFIVTTDGRSIELFGLLEAITSDDTKAIVAIVSIDLVT